MKVYALRLTNYDLDVNFGIYLRREKAEEEFTKLVTKKSNHKSKWWAERYPQNLRIEEVEIIE